MAHGEGLPAPGAQLQPVGPSGLFPEEKTLLHQPGHGALGVAPVQPQLGGELGLGAARVLAHVDQGEERAKVQAQGLESLGGVGGEPPIEDGGAECQSPLHGTASFLDLVKYSLRT